MSFTTHAMDVMLSLITQHMPGPSCIPPSACHPHHVCCLASFPSGCCQGVALTWHSMCICCRSTSALTWAVVVVIFGWSLVTFSGGEGGSINITWQGHCHAWLALRWGIIVLGWCWGGIIVVLGQRWHGASVGDGGYSQVVLTQAFLVWVEEAKMSNVKGVEVVIFGGGYHQNIQHSSQRSICHTHHNLALTARTSHARIQKAGTNRWSKSQYRWIERWSGRWSLMLQARVCRQIPWSLCKSRSFSVAIISHFAAYNVQSEGHSSTGQMKIAGSKKKMGEKMGLGN